MNNKGTIYTIQIIKYKYSNRNLHFKLIHFKLLHLKKLTVFHYFINELCMNHSNTKKKHIYTLSLRMCCSLVCIAIRNAGIPMYDIQYVHAFIYI